MPFIASVRGSYGGQGRFNAARGPLASSTGGTITEVGGYRIHTFLLAQTGTAFTASGSGTVEYLVVAGGGSGGTQVGGGGGAGGMRTGSLSVTAQAYTITVGDGGQRMTDQTPSNASWKGLNSVFSTITSTGGGAGGCHVNTSETSRQLGQPGGSGGGGGCGQGPTASGGAGNTPSVSPSQGNNGGTGRREPWAGGGGGGAGAVGQNGGAVSAAVGGNGGNGTASSISGTSTTYAGGGGGCSEGGESSLASGGAGGGGQGWSTSYHPTTSGVNVATHDGAPNTGGGGGAERDWSTNDSSSSNGPGSRGGSGIVIIRYPI